MNLFRKMKESMRIHDCDEPMHVEGLPPIPPRMAKKVNKFLGNKRLVMWMEEGVQEICKEIRELESKYSAYTKLGIEGNCAVKVRGSSLFIAGVWKKFENYRMKDLRGESHEALSLAVFKYITDRLDQASLDALKDIRYRYELTYEGHWFDDYVGDYVYHIAVKFWIQHSGYTEAAAE